MTPSRMMLQCPISNQFFPTLHNLLLGERKPVARHINKSQLLAGCVEVDALQAVIDTCFSRTRI